MKNIWRIVFLGYLFGMFALVVCVIAVMTGIVTDMGVSLLALPIVCPVVLVLFGHFSSYVYREVLYGKGAFWRWILMGGLAGLAYTIRVLLEERGKAWIWGPVLLVVPLVVFWMIFFTRKGKQNEITNNGYSPGITD